MPAFSRPVGAPKESRISQLAVRARRCCEPSAQRLLALLVADDFESLEAGDIEVLIAGFGGHCAAGLSEVFGTDWADGAIVEALGCGEAAKRMGHSAVSWDMLGPDAFRVARQNGWLLERACAASP